MEKETKDEAIDREARGDTADIQSEATQTEPLAAAEPEYTNPLAQKRGRIMGAGVLTAVLLSVVAVVVAGIFGFTSHWLKVCPTDLPVNDPALQLSQQLAVQEAGPQSLRVSGNIAEETRLKGVGPAQAK